MSDSSSDLEYADSTVGEDPENIEPAAQQAVETGPKGRSFTNPSHQGNLSSKLTDRRNTGFLTDVKLCSGDTTFPCHMIILSLGSSFFQRRCEEEPCPGTDPKTIVLDHIKPDVLGTMIDYMYTGNILITDDMLKTYAQASYILGLKELKEACDKILTNQVVVENCLSLCAFASANDLHCTKQNALDIMLSMPDTVMEKAAESEFYSLGFDDFVDWISSDIIRVKSESIVFWLAVRWMNADLEYRKPKAQQVFQHLRLAHCDPDFIEEKVSKHPLFKKVKACQMMVEEAKQCMHDPELREQMKWTNPSPRKVQTIVLMGGGSGSVENKNIKCYYMKADDSWETLTTLPEALAECPYDLKACLVGVTKIVVSGGLKNYITPAETDAVWMFDIPTREWHELPPMTMKRFNHALLCYQGSLFAFGGFDKYHELTHIAEKLNCLDSDKWVRIAPMVKYMEECVAAIVDQKIYVASGYDQRLQRYDPQKDQWTLLDSIPYDVCSGTRGIAVGDDIYIAGGDERQFFVYRTGEDKWEKLTPYENTCDRPSFAMEWQGKVLLGGGWSDWENYETTDEIEEYDRIKDTWSPSALKLPVKGGYFCSIKTFV